MLYRDEEAVFARVTARIGMSAATRPRALLKETMHDADEARDVPVDGSRPRDMQHRQRVAAQTTQAKTLSLLATLVA